MNGLNVVQESHWATPFYQNNDNSQSQQTTFFAESVDQPFWLNTLLPTMWENDEQNQVYIKRLYKTFTFTNCSQWPIMFEYMKLRLRNDLVFGATPGGNPSVAMGIDAPSPSLPFLSCTTGNTFQKTYKIISKKRKLLNPMRVCKMTAKSIYMYRNRPITGDVEAQDDYLYKRGNTIMVVRAWGIPYQYRNLQLPAAQDTCLSPVLLRGIVNTYCSYYTMGDIDPTSTVVDNIPLSIGAANQNVTLNPTYVNTAYANSQFTSNDYIYPNTVATVAE